MKKKTISILAGAVLSLSVMQGLAQNTAFTFSFYNAAYYVNTSPMTQGYMGIGLERNVGDYISLKLEVNNGFQILYKISGGDLGSVIGSEEDISWEDSLGYSHYFPYHWTVPALDINYQSKFFFNGNDKTGAYMAMGIGIRSVRYILHVGSTDDYSYSSEIPSELQQRDDEVIEKLTVVPLILRIGARGEMDGFFPDFSFGLGYNISHNKTINDNVVTQTWDMKVPKLTGLTVTGSISFGVGW